MERIGGMEDAVGLVFLPAHGDPFVVLELFQGEARIAVLDPLCFRVEWRPWPIPHSEVLGTMRNLVLRNDVWDSAVVLPWILEAWRTGQIDQPSPVV